MDGQKIEHLCRAICVSEGKDPDMQVPDPENKTDALVYVKLWRTHAKFVSRVLLVLQEVQP